MSVSCKTRAAVEQNCKACSCVLPAQAQSCASVPISSADFKCAGFTRDTQQSLQDAAKDLGVQFCNR